MNSEIEAEIENSKNMSSLGRAVEAWIDLIRTFAIGQTLTTFWSVRTWLTLQHLREWQSQIPVPTSSNILPLSPRYLPSYYNSSNFSILFHSFLTFFYFDLLISSNPN
jgi:hypothetical protein